jgi:hypothetical protein
MEKIYPRCGLIAVQLDNIQISSSTWAIHFDVTTTPQIAMLTELALIIAKMDDVIGSEHKFAARVADMQESTTKTTARLQAITTAFSYKGEDTQVIHANFPLITGTLTHEGTIIDYLCTIYKVVCRSNKVQSSISQPTDIEQHILAIEAILHEIEAVNTGGNSDMEILQWTRTQLNTWKRTTSVCDTSMTNYDATFERILEHHFPLLGKTITLPCLSNRQVYEYYDIIPFPMPVDKELWAVPLQDKHRVLYNQESSTADLVNPDDLLSLYPQSNLPYFDGVGIAKQPAPSYITTLIPTAKVAEPELCPAELYEDPLIDKYAIMTAVAQNKWTVVHYRTSSVHLTFRKGAQHFSKLIPAGIHLLTLAKEVLITPSSKNFMVHQRLRSLSKGLFYHSDDTVPEPDNTIKKEIIKQIQKHKFDIFGLPIIGTSWREPLLFAFVFTLLLAMIILIPFCCCPKCKGVRQYLHDQHLIAQRRTTINLYNQPQPSRRVQDAIMPFLQRTTSSQW